MSKNLHKNICEEIVYSNFFKKYAEDLHSFLYYKFGDHLNPKDKVQEAFIKVWENCKNITPEKAKNYLMFAVGSGITPILSLAKTILEPK